MKIKLRKIGTSWGILIPKTIVDLCGKDGEIEVYFGPKKNIPENLEPYEVSVTSAHLTQEERAQAVRDLLSGKKIVEPSAQENVDESATEEDIVYTDEEVPEEYR